MEKQNNYSARAQYSVMQAYQSVGYGVMHICEPDKWPACPAREVALHAIDGLQAGHNTVQSWIDFPGGWPRFMEMFEESAKAAKIEQGESVIDMFSLTMANEVLTAEGIGGK